MVSTVSRLVGCVCLLGVLAAISPLLARQSCSTCKPATNQGVALSGNYKVCVQYGFSETERNALKVGIENYWPGIMANTGSPVTFEVVFADDEPEFLCGPFDPDILVKYEDLGSSAFAIAAPTSNGVGAYISVSSYYMNDYWGTGQTAIDYWQEMAGHELGHLLGFENVEISGCGAYTIMKIPLTGTGLGGPRCSDPDAALLKYPKRDDDSDGYSPDDSGPLYDCDDFDPSIHPNQTPTCDLPTGTDINCNGTPDLQECESPIVIDTVGNGIQLTNRDNGVDFDLNSDGVAERLPWTAEGSDDVWLVLDRNGNGRIDNGTELFGNLTPQPPSDEPNGFLALQVFDESNSGGNGNGWFDKGDLRFSDVAVWHDTNHDGVSQSNELRPLSGVGIRAISLDYRESRRSDQWGNWFRFRAVVSGETNRALGRFAYDVFLSAGRPGGQAGWGPGR